jgi:hypothetical protein
VRWHRCSLPDLHLAAPPRLLARRWQHRCRCWSPGGSWLGEQRHLTLRPDRASFTRLRPTLSLCQFRVNRSTRARRGWRSPTPPPVSDFENNHVSSVPGRHLGHLENSALKNYPGSLDSTVSHSIKHFKQRISNLE